MLSKSDLFLMVRKRLGFTQVEMSKKMKVNRRSTIGKYENSDDKITYYRLCQLYVIYIKLCVRDEQLDNIFDNYIEKMFKED